MVELAGTAELSEGEMKKFLVDDREILLVRVGDTYYAADDRCPHMGGDLSQGKLEGTVLTCPRHHSQFDITDGHVLRWTDWSGPKLLAGKLLRSPRPLRTYSVKVEGERISIAME